MGDRSYKPYYIFWFSVYSIMILATCGLIWYGLAS